MASAEHLDLIRQGALVWNQWMNEHPGTVANLSGAKLDGMDLSGIILNGVNLDNVSLRGANLVNAVLRGVDFSESDITSAKLSRAYLSGVDLSGARLKSVSLTRTFMNELDLRDSSLEYAQLDGTVFKGSDLSGANLRQAMLGDTAFVNCRLQHTNELESCFHSGPSSLDVPTIMHSSPFPLPFLRGCGLSEILIDYLPSLLAEPIQFYSCFISYSTKDQEFATRLHADLQSNGVRCWFAPNDMQGGKKIHEQIDQAIRVYERLLLILSPHSMKSEWVMTEIANARKRERTEHRRMLFPVRLTSFKELEDWECFDSDSGKDSAREIREYYVPDFSSWKDHDPYQAEFTKLLRDLRAQ